MSDLLHVSATRKDGHRPAKLNLGCGHDIRPAEDGWLNVDAFLDDERIMKMDMTKTPWPFADDSFDVVLASHVMEHVPLLYREQDGVTRDILFIIMEEVHRVLKPGGEFHVEVPLGGTDADHSNPQHYRHWRRNWWTFFEPEGKENYYSTARFTVVSDTRVRYGVRFADRLRIGPNNLGLTVHLHSRFPWLRWLLSEHQIARWVVRAVN